MNYYFRQTQTNPCTARIVSQHPLYTVGEVPRGRWQPAKKEAWKINTTIVRRSRKRFEMFDRSKDPHPLMAAIHSYPKSSNEDMASQHLVKICPCSAGIHNPRILSFRRSQEMHLCLCLSRECTKLARMKNDKPFASICYIIQ